MRHLAKDEEGAEPCDEGRNGKGMGNTREKRKGCHGLVAVPVAMPKDVIEPMTHQQRVVEDIFSALPEEEEEEEEEGENSANDEKTGSSDKGPAQAKSERPAGGYTQDS